MLSYFNNAIWIFLEKLIRIAVGFFFLGMISRELGARDFGVLSFAQTTATMLLCITNLGLDNVLINEFSKKNNNEKTIFTTALISRVAISVAFILISTCFVFYYNIPALVKLVYIVSFISLIFQSQTTYFSYYQAKSKSLTITRLSLLSLLISSLYKAYLLYINAGMLWFAISYTIDFIVSFLVIFICTQRSKKLFAFNAFSMAVLKDLVKKSWPIIASSVLVVMYTRLDQLMIMKMLGAESLGIYNVAVKIAESYIFVPAALATSLYPLVSNEFTKKNIKFYFDLVFMSSLVCGIATLVACYFIIPVLFGKEYAASFNVLSVTILSSMFAVLGGACTNVMIIQNLAYMRLIRAVVGLIINFVLNIIFIPQYGIMGAAFASLIAQIFASWLSNVLNAKSHECFWLQTQSIITLGLAGTLQATVLIITGVKEKFNVKNKKIH